MSKIDHPVDQLARDDATAAQRVVKVKYGWGSLSNQFEDRNADIYGLMGLTQMILRLHERS